MGKWRDLAAQVAPSMTKKKMRTMIVDTLPVFYYEKMVGYTPSSFADLVFAGTYTLREFPERFAKDRIRFPTSRVQSFWMTDPLDESISCFLIKVDPWVLVPITFRGLYVLAIRGLHILACRGLHALAFRGLPVLIFIPGPPPDIGGRPTGQAHPEREAITHLLCIPGQDFTRADAKRCVRIMHTNMTTLTWIWMTLLFSNILPSDHNSNLPLQMDRAHKTPNGPEEVQQGPGVSSSGYGPLSVLQGTCSPSKESHPQRHPVDLEKSNRALGFPALVTGLCSPTGCPFPPARSHHHDIGIAPARHPVNPKKSNRFYGVPVAPSKVIRPLTNRAFIKKYCAPRQAQGETPQQPGDGRQRATDAPPPPLEFTSAHPQKVASPLSLPFSIPLPFIFQEAKESIDEEDPRPTSSNGACIIVNGEGSTPKDPLYKILDELRSLKLWKEKQERKDKGKKRVEEISQDEREKIREEERRKIMKEMKREKHVSYSSHNSCKSLSEELRDYYEGRHRSHLRPHSHRRENERKPQEVNIKLPYFHGKDNVEANLDWEIRVEQQFKRKSTSKSYGSHSYQKKDQGQGILGVRPSKPKDDKGKTIEKKPLKASMQEKTSSMKCFKCLGRGHITSQCPTKKTMIMRGQDLYSSQDEATTSPSSSKSEEAKGEESSEEIYPQEEGQPLMVKEECKEVSVSSKRLAKKERHFEIKTNIKEISLLRQPPHFLLCKKTLVSIATSLRLEFNPQVKELLDEGIIRHQIPKIGGVMNVLGGATLFCKITCAPNIFMICVHRDSLGSFNTNLGTHMGHLRFVILFGRNNQHENTEKGVEEKSPAFQEPRDLSSQKWSLNLSQSTIHSKTQKLKQGKR
ncbi:hypothetical protein HKD37_19G053344 [Glycine soja]